MNREAGPEPDLRGSLAALLPDLRGFARFLVRDRAEADDLVQEAVVRALGALAQFQAGSNMRAWTFTILRNTYYEQARRRRSETRALLEQLPAVDGHAPAQDSQAALSELRRFVWALPPLLREALVLVGAQGLAYEEAAAICNVPVGTMKARVSRARTRLAQLMDGQAESRDEKPLAGS